MPSTQSESPFPRLAPLDLREVWSAPPDPIDFVIPGLALGTVGNVVGTGGTGKTFLMLATALSVATGRDLGGLWGCTPTAGRAVFLSLEDPDVVLRTRLHALLPHLLPGDEEAACDTLDVLPCAGRGFALAKPTRAEQDVTPWFGALASYLEKRRPRLLVIDTLNRALGGVAENDSGAMGWLIGEIEGIAREARCAVVLCHHVSKHALVTSGAGEAHAARGSSVITDNARWQCNLSLPSREDFSDVVRGSFVRLDFSKTNYGPPLPARWLRRGASGTLAATADPPPKPKRQTTSRAKAPSAAEPSARPAALSRMSKLANA